MMVTLYKADNEHKVLYKELVDLCAKHPNVSAREVLAIAANMLGKILAMQDQRTMTREVALETIKLNIETGNAEAVAELKGKPAGHA